jgi:hypothetical protein
MAGDQFTLEAWRAVGLDKKPSREPLAIREKSPQNWQH